jgi:hypothetical protein
LRIATAILAKASYVALSDSVEFFGKLNAYHSLKRKFGGEHNCGAFTGTEVNENKAAVVNRKTCDRAFDVAGWLAP